LGLLIDYPRINQFPEWFTASLSENLEIFDDSQKEAVALPLLRDQGRAGLSVKVDAGRELRWRITRK
jgi:hypothetical protein